MPDRQLPPNVYLQSYLQKAGIKFSVNVVDTICKKGLGTSFFVVACLLSLIFVLQITGHADIFPTSNYFLLLSLIFSIYLTLYVLRLCYFNYLSRKLKNDRLPIATEAYAIVLLDVQGKGIFNFPPFMRLRKSAVLYKEVGSVQPRFFTGAVRYGFRQHYHKNQIAKVFIDRKNPKLYCVDDIHAHKTVARRILGARLSINNLDRGSYKIKSLNLRQKLFKRD